MPNKKKTTWVATFDGQVGRIYTLAGDGNLRHLAEEGMDARPGQENRQELKDIGPSTLPYDGSVDFSTEEQFVKTFTGRLEQRALSGAFDRLIVSADPKSLATFRKAADQRLKEKVSVELNKDHVHTPVKALEQAISEHL
jgi:protein required for attachment to host cells